ncbi:hypothetical protein ACFYPB_41695 [Streptomyces olivaceoviridis]|uniref:hypothetical protein n=1 Tax=Streptomyces olivaceoviridis TaxID=1921 RepID=UPI0036D1485C
MGRSRADTSLAMEPDAGLLERAGLPSRLRTGSLLFPRPSDDSADCAALVDRWVATTSDLDQPVRLQAGFGWPWTTTRSYGVDRLNRPDGPRYIRISVGAVNPTHATQQALALNTVSDEQRFGPGPAAGAAPAAGRRAARPRPVA